MKRFVAILGALALTMGACSDDDDDGAAANEPDAAESVTDIRFILPVSGPLVYGYEVAEELEYYADESVNPSFEIAEGGAGALQQLLSGNADMAHVPTGNVLEAVERGQDNLRSIFNVIYGQLFFINVLEDSEIVDAEDLEGANIGVASLAGGESNIIEGLLDSVGISIQDVNIIAVGAGPAVALDNLQNGSIDAFAGSISEVAPLEIQAPPMRTIEFEALGDLPAASIITTADFLEENPQAVEGFLRATSMGYALGHEDEEGVASLLEKINPESDPDAQSAILSLIIPVVTAPGDDPFGSQTVDGWVRFGELVGPALSESDLEAVVYTDLVEPANEYDAEALGADLDGESG